MKSTVYDRIRTMSKSELDCLIQAIYHWGHINEECNTDDTLFYRHFLDEDESMVDYTINRLATLVLYRVTVHDGEHDIPMRTKYYSLEDAIEWLTRKYNAKVLYVGQEPSGYDNAIMDNGTYKFSITPVED